MDDHLFVNLRTPCSRFVTVREMKISHFLHFFFHVRQLLALLSSKPLRTMPSWESSGYWSREECERAM